MKKQRTILDSIIRYSLATLQAQLVLTLASMPILVNWGLPLSAMTLVGNVIFLPFLTVFIFLSSLLFFTQLCCIPNQLLVVLLDATTSCWRYCLSFGSMSWLVGFCHPGAWVLIISSIIIVTVLVVCTKLPTMKRLALLSSTTFLLFVLLWLGNYFHTKKTITTPTHTLVYNNNKITFVDQGYFASKASPHKAAYFQLRPEIIKHYGTMQLNAIVIKKVGVRSLQGTLELCHLFKVEKVYIPYFRHKLSKKGWYFFFTLKRYLAENKIKLFRKKPRRLML